MIKDTSFMDMIKYKKYKDIYNFQSIESIVSLVGSILITIAICTVISQTCNADVNTIIRSLTKDIGIAMIGLLGFIVAGLAILTSAITSKIMNIIKKKDKIAVIERIFLSFYLLSFITAIAIMASFFLYIISFFNSKINYGVLAIVTFIFSYLIIFIIFYSVALLGNCVQIFKIINTFDDVSNQNIISPEDKMLYDSFRITALERIVFLEERFTPVQKVAEYKKVLIMLIDSECKDEIQRKHIKDYINKCFGDYLG